MSPDLVAWLNGFLRSRKMDCPDGRALYAYRCTSEEFDSLTEALKCRPLDMDVTSPHDVNVQVRAFVLYAAEYWQRRYAGGHWAWEPLLESIHWGRIHYPDLYKPVRAALSWWKVDLVRLPASVRYLGTFACQGGLPLDLVGDADSRVAQYLRAVLNHAVEYRQFVDDVIDLARDQQRFLRPPTLRRDYVFRLAADLIQAVLDLRDAAQGQDPIAALDSARPDWRKDMPLSLENKRARNLLTSLLREATQVKPSTDDFRVERFLRKTGEGWRLGARVRIPASISAKHFAPYLNVSVGDLPPRMQVRVYGDRVRNIGLYARESEEFCLVDRGAQSQVEVWDAAAAAEIRLQFLSGGEIGEGVIPYRGGALGELPWVFREDAHECPFIGEGSVSNRAPELVALVLDECAVKRAGANEESTGAESERPDSSAEDEIRILNRTFWRIAEHTVIETDHGECVVKPSSEQAAEDDYQWSGQRYYKLESAWPLFRGRPKLRVARAGQAPRAAPANEVAWRQKGQKWEAMPADAFGLWEVRHMRRGEIRYFGRVGILPEQFRLSLKPDSSMHGDLVLHGAKAVKVSAQDEGITLTTQIINHETRIQVAVQDKALPPSRISFKLHWHGQSQIYVKAPFPGRGGHFSRDGQYLDQKFMIDDLYGVRAVALSPSGDEKFWLYGELKTFDLSRDLLGAANFKIPLRKSGLIYELPLFEIKPVIEQLLAASSSSEAKVELRIMSSRKGLPKPNQPEYAEAKRFDALLEYDDDGTSISMSPVVDDNDDAPITFEALSLANPDGSVDSIIDPAQALKGLNFGGCWLIVARHGEQVRVQPVVIGGSSSDSAGENHAEAPCLREAMSVSDQDLRQKDIEKAIHAMLHPQAANHDEEEVSFLTNSLLRTEGLPATEFDIFKVLASNPQLLVRCMFHLESAPRQLLWELENKLPFSWLLIKRDIWWDEANYAFERLHNQLEAITDKSQALRMACEHVRSIFTEGVRQIQELRTVERDVHYRLMGHTIPDSIIKESRKNRDDKTQSQLNLRATMDDWPKGNGRREWVDDLGHGRLLNTLNIWQDEGKQPWERSPIFDTPIAAAWCCFKSSPDERATFLVKRTRAHDPDWFYVAYEAAWFQLAGMQDREEI